MNNFSLKIASIHPQIYSLSTKLKIKELCNCENFVKIDGDNIRVVLDSKDSNTSSANNIMRLVQNEFEDKMYISVKYN